jgi:thiosulfate/3-mercaptopyruvate sulfurtransferase
MLTDIGSWKKIMEDIGIENKDEIVVYDNSDVISSCRCWYNLIYFGHDPKLVHVLDGGFKKWKKENKTTNNNEVITKTSVYSCKENAELVKNKKQIDENINKNEFNVVDARSRERFEGKVAEPRKGLRSGSIKNSFCLPFNELINDDHTFVNKDKISERFKSLNFDYSKNLVFSCGSGVTASVLALAYSIINDKYMPTIYDGSWSEYGKI